MPAVSQAQQRFMAVCEHANHPPFKCPNMTKNQMREFAATPRTGLPPHVQHAKGHLKGLSHHLSK